MLKAFYLSLALASITDWPAATASMCMCHYRIQTVVSFWVSCSRFIKCSLLGIMREELCLLPSMAYRCNKVMGIYWYPAHSS